jgi:hypothetical protein
MLLQYWGFRYHGKLTQKKGIAQHVYTRSRHTRSGQH